MLRVAAVMSLALMLTIGSTCWAVGYVTQEIWESVDTVTLDDAILTA